MQTTAVPNRGGVGQNGDF